MEKRKEPLAEVGIFFELQESFLVVDAAVSDYSAQSLHDGVDDLEILLGNVEPAREVLLVLKVRCRGVEVVDHVVIRVALRA